MKDSSTGSAAAWFYICGAKGFISTHTLWYVPLKDVSLFQEKAPLSKTLDKTLYSDSAHHCHGDFLCTVGENMSCSSGQAPHLHPTVGHSSVQVSAKELIGPFLWGACVPMALLPLPHLPCSTIYHHLLHSLGFFFFSFEVSLLPFQSGCWNLSPIIICIYSPLCKHLRAPLASTSLAVTAQS